MSSLSKSSKATEWRRRIRRFSQSKLTVAAFCKKEQVSVPSFYQWRRKLSGSSTGRRTGKPKASSAFRSVALVTPGHVVSVMLACGTRIEVPSESTEAVRESRHAKRSDQRTNLSLPTCHGHAEEVQWAERNCS